MKFLLQILALPLTIVYGLIIFIRNKCYDWKLLNEKSFTTAIISIGNLSVGGTGKTPHIEYLIRLFNNYSSTVVLSRGYKRKTKGFILADSKSTMSDIGDEPLQYKLKFDKLTVAVDEKRVHGVQEIINRKPKTNIILLDDAYQHRAIKPGLNILITDFNNLFFNDYLMPSGKLREWRFGYKRADIIIISKSPKKITNFEQKTIIQKINPTPSQKVYFSSIKYSELIPFTKSSKEFSLPENTSKIDIVLVSGIANPLPLINHLDHNFKSVQHIDFPDHHNFTNTDINKIKKIFSELNGNNKIIITTEKDIMRLSLPEISIQIEDIPVFYIPIEIYIIGEGKKEFDKQILDYVETNTRN